jgi:hypothetical protein
MGAFLRRRTSSSLGTQKANRSRAPVDLFVVHGAPNKKKNKGKGRTMRTFLFHFSLTQKKIVLEETIEVDKEETCRPQKWRENSQPKNKQNGGEGLKRRDESLSSQTIHGRIPSLALTNVQLEISNLQQPTHVQQWCIAWHLNPAVGSPYLFYS